MNQTLLSLLPYVKQYGPLLLAFVAGVLVQAKHPLLAQKIKADVASVEAAAVAVVNKAKSL